MQIDQESLLALDADAAADQLFQAGRALRGRNLRRASWLLIAGALHAPRTGEILLARLAAARTREDALRALRIARKAGRTRKQATGGARRRGPRENPHKVIAETSPEMFANDDDIARNRAWLDEEIWPRAFYEEWLLDREGARIAARRRAAGLLPLSPLQDAIDRYAWERQRKERPAPEDLRSWLDARTFRRLVELGGIGENLRLSDGELGYLAAHGLTEMLNYARQPHQVREPLRVTDGFALAGLRLLEDRSEIGPPPAQVDWAGVAGWLAERLAQPPAQEETTAVIAAAYGFYRDAPTGQVEALLARAAGWRPEWASLLWYAYQRMEELLPEEDSEGIYFEHFSAVRWEHVLDAGSGSRLVLYNLQNNLRDALPPPVGQPIGLPGRYRRRAQRLLLAGGGSLRRMDYPAFTLVARPSISLVRMETFETLSQLAGDLHAINWKMQLLDRAMLAEWMEDTYLALSGQALPGSASRLIAAALERHALAYLMLTERVLREALAAAPFRLRRRHIQRFWDGQPGGRLDAAMPATIEALREAFGLDKLQEALAHALLDHFKDDWGLPAEHAQPLKETLLTLLRWVAISYRMEYPWQPPPGEQPRAEDMEHTQELANVLIQQTENAPLELAQALQLAPHQGLPLLAGGQRTPLEQRCRRAVREAAGVSQQKMVDGAARVFECRPLAKTAALDRGDLAGDCSSDVVPLRALSPHHTYYGVFENGQQQRGYMTVYEAWAELEGEEGPEPARPALCLETINVPLRAFDAVQQDLLLLFEAIAASRGLTGGLVLITRQGTWNYHNGEVLRQSRRARQGRPARLSPADPASWQVYQAVSYEATRFSAFVEEPHAGHYAQFFRRLAPFDPALDLVEPENLVEAQRITALPPKRPRITARDADGPAGFISDLPEIR